MTGSPTRSSGNVRRARTDAIFKSSPGFKESLVLRQATFAWLHT